MLPLARAFAAAGHDVAFATAAVWEAWARAEGFDFLRVGLEPDVADARNAPRRAALQSLPIPDRRPYAFTTRFAIIEAPERVDDVRVAVRSWGAELVVHEAGDLTAPLVATELELPSVHHGFGRMVPLRALAAAAEAMEPLWRAAGLAPTPYAGAFRGAYVDIVPPSLSSDAPPDGVRVERLRPAEPAPAEGEPEWLASLPGRPTVYVTLGTVFNAVDRFRTLLAALGGLDVNVVATVGAGVDPATLAPLPRNAHVERYVPQEQVLRHVTVVVAHGGSGSMLGALAHGLPMLLLPRGADQFENAEACVEAGAGLALLPDEVSPDAVREAVLTLLEEPSYAAAARAVADEIAAMPSPDELVPVLLDGG